MAVTLSSVYQPTNCYPRWRILEIQQASWRRWMQYVLHVIYRLYSMDTLYGSMVYVIWKYLSDKGVSDRSYIYVLRTCCMVRSNLTGVDTSYQEYRVLGRYPTSPIEVSDTYTSIVHRASLVHGAVESYGICHTRSIGP